MRRSPELPPIPDETASVAGLVYEGGNGFLTLGDRQRSLFAKLDFETMWRGETPQESSSSLAMVTIFQFIEGLTDGEAVTAVRTRVDWDYALHLPLDHAGFDPKSLAEFRARLVTDRAAGGAFETLLQRVRAATPRWPWPSEAQDAAAVVSSVELINALPIAIKALWLAVEALTMEAPGWLWERPWLQSRYAHSHGWLRLPADSRERERLAKTVENDGLRLMAEATAHGAPAEVSSLAELTIVWHVWRWQFGASTPLRDEGSCLDPDSARRAAG